MGADAARRLNHNGRNTLNRRSHGPTVPLGGLQNHHCNDQTVIRRADSGSRMPNDANPAKCALCGAEQHLEEDPNHPHIHYCTECLKRAGRHKRIIKEGFDEENPGY